jgi:hypothetical protein
VVCITSAAIVAITVGMALGRAVGAAVAATLGTAVATIAGAACRPYWSSIYAEPISIRSFLLPETFTESVKAPAQVKRAAPLGEW